MIALATASFDRALPFRVAGRPLQTTVAVGQRGVEALQLMDTGFVFLKLEGAPPYLIPPHRLVACQPAGTAQAPAAGAPAKRRGRPPGSKNKKVTPDDSNQPDDAAGEGLPGN